MHDNVLVTTRIRHLDKVVPRHCRKERCVERGTWVKTCLAKAPEADAPVALRLTGCGGDKEGREYRLWRGSLYVECPDPENVLCDHLMPAPADSGVQRLPEGYSDEDEPVSDRLPAWRGEYEACGFDAKLSELSEWLGRYALVGDRLWQKAEEPMYEIEKSRFVRRKWTARIRDKGQYNALEYGKLAAMRDLAASGHPEISASIEGRIEVLIPEAVAAPRSAESKGLTVSDGFLVAAFDLLDWAAGTLGCSGEASIEHGCDPCPFLGSESCRLDSIRETLSAVEGKRDALKEDLARRARRGFDPHEGSRSA